MSLYFITGKSLVLSELRYRGYEAYDVDEVGPVTAKWHNDHTGLVHPKSSIKKSDRTSEFFKHHSWKVSRQEVEMLSNHVSSNTVFLSGTIANEIELQDLFRMVFALIIDNQTLKHRLATRSNNDWGKNSHELMYTLTINHELEERYNKYGYVVIDASQPASAVTTEILNHIHDN